MRIFKYLHPDRTDVLRDGVIRFSSPKALNDPFELKPHISALMRKEQIPADVSRLMPKVVAETYAGLAPEIRAIISPQLYQAFVQAFVAPNLGEIPAMAGAIFDMLLPKAKDVLFQKFEELVGILCVTESPTNLLMWAHYAEAHQGFVIEFDPESQFFDQRLGPEDDFRHLRKVVYQEERPSIVLTEIEDFAPFLTKGKDWSYEAEWRMMMPFSSASRVILDGSTAIHLFEFPKSMVRCVICGCRMSDSKKAEIRQILLGTPEYENVQCVDARIDETRYRLLLTDAVGTNRSFQQSA